jgi:hypothetical protein
VVLLDSCGAFRARGQVGTHGQHPKLIPARPRTPLLPLVFWGSLTF